jgi:hypothetical protein
MRAQRAAVQVQAKSQIQPPAHQTSFSRLVTGFKAHSKAVAALPSMLATVAHFAHKQLALFLAAMCAITTLQHVQLLQLPRIATSISSIQKPASPFAAPAAPVAGQLSGSHAEVRSGAVLGGRCKACVLA